MRRLFRRSILWLLPVVVLPIGALLVMQVRTLRSLEQKTASAERNWLRNSLELVTAEIESRYRVAAGSALTLSPAQLSDVNTLGGHFRRQRVPGAQTFFTVRFTPHLASIGYFDRWGKEKLPTDPEVEAVKLSTVSWHFAHKMYRVAPSTTLHVDERDRRHRVILKPVVDASMHIVGVAGVILDEGTSRKWMEVLARDTITQRYPRNAATIKFRFADDYTTAEGRRFITQPLGFVFTNWRAGIRDTCLTPEELAATQFRHNAMWTGGAFVVLLGAIGLSVGAVARQMRLSQMKSEFVSNVSHELRTPLSSIRVFGEYMRLGRVQQPEKVREYGEYIEAESRRLTQLINNILDFSKIESAEKQYRFCDVDVTDLVAQTVAAFAVPLRDQSVLVRFHPPAVKPGLLHIDKDAVCQAVMNLLDNALKYSSERKEIDVTIAADQREVRVAVRDRGIGIPASEQKKIFEKFYRVGSGLVHDVKGSGLGLSIVEHVAKAHGGRVELASAPGEGSTFTLVLPVKRVIPSAARDPLLRT
ncbi:MAG TPA: HAMP domain-containing sensor histidine kinase, partial [Thermoanaerobaculia bacterium]|nr:HAMP domain-containing sensor histidine kinase [Thermoanaerobaculia bacterium]